MADFALMRRMMVDNQLRTFDVTDQAVLGAMDDVARETFVPEAVRPLAYSDGAIDITFDGVTAERSMMSPMVLARMLQAAELEPEQVVLDVASGTGYSAAVIAQIAGRVVALESDPVLAGLAKDKLAHSANVSVVTGSITEGAAQQGPFDVIVVNGSFEVEPTALLQQLRDGGCLVGVRAVAGAAARIVRYRRSGEDFGLANITNAFARKLPEFALAPAFVF